MRKIVITEGQLKLIMRESVDQEMIDRILDKIGVSGMDSLTSRELSILKGEDNVMSKKSLHEMFMEVFTDERNGDLFMQKSENNELIVCTDVNTKFQFFVTPFPNDEMVLGIEWIDERFDEDELRNLNLRVKSEINDLSAMIMFVHKFVGHTVVSISNKIKEIMDRD